MLRDKKVRAAKDHGKKFQSNSHNSGNFHLNEERKISKSKLRPPLSDTKKLKNQTKGFCSIVDQTQDLFWDTQ